MKISDGISRVKGVSLGEFQSNLLGEHPSLSGKFALINGDGTTRFGAHTKISWGPETWEKFRALVESMEQDALMMLFEGETSQASGVITSEATIDGTPSL